MTNHTTDQTSDHLTVQPDVLVSRPDGRLVAVDDRGDAAGRAVLLLHSAPGSRRLDPDPEVTAAAGVRLITIDRPGYGASTARPPGSTPTLAEAADDAAAVLAHLDMSDAAIVGWSVGGLVALGVAARHPELVRSVALVGTPAPDDEVPWIAEGHRDILHAMRSDPASASTQMAGFMQAMGIPEPRTDLVGGGPADDAVLADAGFAATVEEMLAEAFVQGPFGVADDIVATNVVPWGFDAAAVGPRVSLFYADGDDTTPPTHGRYWAGVLADAEQHQVTGVGHLLLLTEWAAILDAVG